MAYTSLGLDIGTRSVKYVLLQNSNQDYSILQSGEQYYSQDEADPNNLTNTLSLLREQLYGKGKTTIDAIGMTVDPTKTLSTHRILPFNAPEKINQILPLQLNDIWTIDENTQLAFEVGKYIAESNEGGGDELQRVGYDVKVLNYPKSELIKAIETTRLARLEPHIILPANEALVYAVNSIFKTQSFYWILLDIGDQITTLTIFGQNQDAPEHNTEIILSRSFKLGSATIDNILAETFGIEQDEARKLKERSGFVCDPGKEEETYNRLVFGHNIEVASVNAIMVAQSCTRGLEMIASPIRQTLLNFVTKYHIEPQALYLCGGGSKLIGLKEWFERNYEIQCSNQLPASLTLPLPSTVYPLDAAAAAIVAANNITSKYSLNLRQGALAHKGNLGLIKEKAWIFASLVVLIIGALIFMTVTKNRTIKQEHDQLKAALEQKSQNVFGKKLLTYAQIDKELKDSAGHNFLPEKDAFSHLLWLSNQITGLTDVEMDLTLLDINTLRKVVKMKGEITGDEGLPKFLQRLEQYECFPNDIPEQGITHSKDKLTFNMSIDAQCPSGDSSE